MFRLALLTLLVYFPILSNDFVQWDDDQNILNNPDFRGLGPESLKWAWTTFLLGVYQPVAWMILGAQWTVWGLKPAGYHLTSLLLHLANTCLVFLLAADLIGRARPDWARDRARLTLTCAGFAAAWFGLHPMRVEAVAWVSCQPYLPAAGFAMLAVLAYLRAAPVRPRRDEPDGNAGRGGDAGKGGADALDRRWFAVSVVAFALAILSKAVAVGVVAAFVVLDVYPLRRLSVRRPRDERERAAVRRALLEKIPFVLLAAGGLAIAYAAKASGGVFVPLESSGPMERLAVMAYGAVFYVERSLIPTGVSTYHVAPPNPSLRDPSFGARFVALIAASGLIWALRRRAPGLAAAGLIYLAIAAPTLGGARIGDQLVAERYGYLAVVPWTVVFAAALIAVSHSSTETSTAREGEPRPRPRSRGPAPALLGMSVALAAFIPLTYRQCLAWRDSLSLWLEAERAGGGSSPVVLNGLALALWERDPNRGDAAEVERLYRRAIELAPRYDVLRINLGLLLQERGQRDEALLHLQRACELKPENALHHRVFGHALAVSGRLEEAEAALRRAAELDPRLVDAWFRLAHVRERLGRDDDADLAYLRAIGDPNAPAAAPGPGDDRETARLMRARFLIEQRRADPDELLRLVAPILRARPEHLEARLRKAQAHRLGGDALRARAELLEILRRRPDHAEAAALLDRLDADEANDSRRLEIELEATPAPESTAQSVNPGM